MVVDLNVPKCGKGWIDYEGDETCYQFSSIYPQLSWQAASTYCKGFGADLTTIKSPEEQLFLYGDVFSLLIILHLLIYCSVILLLNT